MMRRFRFYVPGDGRPMTFPPEGPFWITGQSDTHTVVVAYSPDLVTLTIPGRWPDAEVTTDLLTPPDARCLEARGSYDEIAAQSPQRPVAEMARLRVYVLAACVR